jgi:nucleotide-binding universal stress UspA family protein
MEPTEPQQAGRPPDRPGPSQPPEAPRHASAPGHARAPSHADSPGQADDCQELDHPVVAGFDGSDSSRNALAYAAGVARRLERPLLIVYVTLRAAYGEPLTGQVVGTVGDEAEIRRWLIAELDQVCDAAGLEVFVTIRCGAPARELAAAAAERNADALIIGASSHAWHQVIGSVPGWLAGTRAAPSPWCPDPHEDHLTSGHARHRLAKIVAWCQLRANLALRDYPAFIR